ncbi:zinc knuckle, partial [Ostertagia ostertagi]
MQNKPNTILETEQTCFVPESREPAQMAAGIDDTLMFHRRAQYEALAKTKKRTFYTLVNAMKEMCKEETRNKKIIALGELKRLRKPESQSVGDFCVELERLTRRAYPELEERTLSVIRADHLYDQLSHWDESCPPTRGFGRTWWRHSKQSSKPARIVRRIKKALDMKCFKCKKAGHMARGCKSTVTGETNRLMSLSARVRGVNCSDISNKHGHVYSDPPPNIVGKRSTIDVSIRRRDRKALLDMGSEVSILSAKVLEEAMEDGIDIDAKVKQIASTKIAERRAMDFLTAVEIDVLDKRQQGNPVRMLRSAGQLVDPDMWLNYLYPTGRKSPPIFISTALSNLQMRKQKMKLFATLHLARGCPATTSFQKPLGSAQKKKVNKKYATKNLFSTSPSVRPQLTKCDVRRSCSEMTQRLREIEDHNIAMRLQEEEFM